MSRQATIALINLVSRGKKLQDAVTELHENGKAAYEDEALPNGKLKKPDEPGEQITLEEALKAAVKHNEGNPPQEPETGADGSENAGEGQEGDGAPSEPETGTEETVTEGTVGEGTEQPTEEASTEPSIEIPANWAELEWHERLKLAKDVAAAMNIADPTSVTTKDDVSNVITAAIATLSA